MAYGKIPTPDDLRKLLRYDPETGALRYKRAWPEMFQPTGRLSAEVRCNRWNLNHAGMPAFEGVSTQGYRAGTIMGLRLCAHRVIIAMTTGEWPAFVDHINGNRQDNRLTNLRTVSRAENGKNVAKPTTNTSGHVGVGWRPDMGKWRATICANQKTKHLGTFDSLEEAIAARGAANKEYGFHPNHGRDLT